MPLSDRTVGSIEVGSREVDSTEVGSTEVASTEVASIEVGSTEVGSREVGSTEVGSTEVGSIESASKQTVTGCSVGNLGLRPLDGSPGSMTGEVSWSLFFPTLITTWTITWQHWQLELLGYVLCWQVCS